MAESLETSFIKDIKSRITESGLSVVGLQLQETGKLPIALRGIFYTCATGVEATDFVELNKRLNVAEKKIKDILAYTTSDKELFYLPPASTQKIQRSYAGFLVAHEVGNVVEDMTQKVESHDPEELKFWQAVLSKRKKPAFRSDFREVVNVRLYNDSVRALVEARTPANHRNGGSLSSARLGF